MTALDLRVSDNEQAFAALENEWRGLLPESPADNLFLTWE